MKCRLCGSEQQDEIQYGQFIRSQNITVHMYCLYFSSGLQRSGRDDNGFYGYLPNAILKQGRLFNNWNCCYCNKKTANIRCSNKDCQRRFHLICGIKNGSRNQFVAPYRSYCHRHVKVPNYRPKRNEYCCICYDKLVGESTRFNPATMLRSPCCRHNWFHKLCLQTFAHSSGNLFRCPVCNNNNTFLTTMRYWGVFVQDNIGQQNEEEIIFHDIVRLPIEEAIIVNNPRQQYEEERPIQEIRINHEQDYSEDEYDDYDYGYGYSYRSTSNTYTPTYESKGLRWLNWIADNVLSHPFIVLRQQCQVNVVSRKFHLLPFSLLPIITELYSQQGAKTFWKGLGFSLIFKGISLIPQTDYFSDEGGKTSIYILRKCIDAAKFCLKRSFLMSTVGSLLAPNVHATNHGRKISLISLFFPYLCMEVAKDVFRSRLRKRLAKNNSWIPWKCYEMQKIEIRTDLIARIITEVAFYPSETMLHRLLVQGTGTIVDNLDNGKTLQHIRTFFEGVQDCYSTIVSMEGYTGFYKGFGALIMQFSVHTVVTSVGMLIFS